MYFLAAARSPGLDVTGIDVYTLAMDLTAIIRNVLEYFSRSPLLTLYEIPSIPIAEGISWKFLAYRDESGTLHRFDFVDYIPEDPIADLHSWEVFGDIAAADAPMVLHYVAIGKRQGSHQQSPWCRAYAHPRVANIFRFNKNSGEDLKDSWKPVYFSGNEKNNSKTWVNWMERDGAASPLVRNIQVKEVSEEHIKGFRRDVMYEVNEMEKLNMKASPSTLPLSRYSCDKPFSCPHQPFCYSSGKETLDSIGIYKRVKESELLEV
ncbi:MAG: hypothetical protein ACREJN_08845 [Nitrospiraceae bacterium]